MCALAVHQPANHQKLEQEVTKELSTDAQMPAEHSAQPISKEIMGARRHGTSAVPKKAMFVTNDEHRAQPFITELDGARTHGITVDPNTETLVKDRERRAMPDISTFDMARTRKTKSSAISLPCYEKLMAANAILTPMRDIRMELEAANKSDMRVHGMCSLELSVHGLVINMDTLVVDLNLSRYPGHGCPGRCV